MYLVDTSVWVGYFNGARHQLEAVRELIASREKLFITGIVLSEVLQGFKSDSGFESAREALTALPGIPLGLEECVAAAKMYRSLRAKGITVRGVVDSLIAAQCISNELTLVSSDKDFEPFVRHFRLKLRSV